jgi:hypothetical protein
MSMSSHHAKDSENFESSSSMGFSSQSRVVCRNIDSFYFTLNSTQLNRVDASKFSAALRVFEVLKQVSWQVAVSHENRKAS